MQETNSAAEGQASLKTVPSRSWSCPMTMSRKQEHQDVEEVFEQSPGSRRQVRIDEIDTNVEPAFYRERKPDEGQPDQDDPRIGVRRRHRQGHEMPVDELRCDDDDQRHHQNRNQPLEDALDPAQRLVQKIDHGYFCAALIRCTRPSGQTLPS